LSEPFSGWREKMVTSVTKKVVIKPLEDRIVVKPLEAEQTTASGLVIPDTAREEPQKGEVLAVGPGRFDESGANRLPMDVDVGDVVLYSKYGGTEVKYHGEEYLVLSARDVLGIVSGEGELTSVTGDVTAPVGSAGGPPAGPGVGGGGRRPSPNSDPEPRHAAPGEEESGHAIPNEAKIADS
jgi:chaperonin GroES